MRVQRDRRAVRSREWLDWYASASQPSDSLAMLNYYSLNWFATKFSFWACVYFFVSFIFVHSVYTAIRIYFWTVLFFEFYCLFAKGSYCFFAVGLAVRTVWRLRWRRFFSPSPLDKTRERQTKRLPNGVRNVDTSDGHRLFSFFRFLFRKLEPVAQLWLLNYNSPVIRFTVTTKKTLRSPNERTMSVTLNFANSCSLTGRRLTKFWFTSNGVHWQASLPLSLSLSKKSCSEERRIPVI